MDVVIGHPVAENLYVMLVMLILAMTHRPVEGMKLKVYRVSSRNDEICPTGVLMQHVEIVSKVLLQHGIRVIRFSRSTEEASGQLAKGCVNPDSETSAFARI